MENWTSIATVVSEEKKCFEFMFHVPVNNFLVAVLGQDTLSSAYYCFNPGNIKSFEFYSNFIHNKLFWHFEDLQEQNKILIQNVFSML